MHFARAVGTINPIRRMCTTIHSLGAIRCTIAPYALLVNMIWSTNVIV
jgi:hypothetical protein